MQITKLLFKKCFSTAKEYSLTMSRDKPKTMAFKGKYSVRTEIIINNNTLEQVSHYEKVVSSVNDNYVKNKISVHNITM